MIFDASTIFGKTLYLLEDAIIFQVVGMQALGEKTKVVRSSADKSEVQTVPNEALFETIPEAAQEGIRWCENRADVLRGMIDGSVRL